jgi:hypothetical protein
MLPAMLKIVTKKMIVNTNPTRKKANDEAQKLLQNGFISYFDFYNYLQSKE